MASSRGVRAGRAFVELYADNSRLVRGLRNAQRRIQAFGGMVRNAGLGMVAAGAAIIAPLLAAGKVFADTGDRLAKMSRRTGIAVEALSELEVAAELSGSSIQNMEKGIRRMQKSINDAGKGLSTPNDALEQMGLRFEDLNGLDPEKQFETIAEAISKVEDPTIRAALAQDMFGRAGTELLPLMAQGADGMRELRKEAHRLGLVMTKEDAKAAEDLTDAWSRVKFAMRGIMQTVGAAIAGPLTKAANITAKIVARAIAWIKQNRKLVQTVLAVGIGIVAMGTALVGAGLAIQAVAFAIGGLIKVIALFGLAVKVAGVALAFLASPIGIVLAAGAALVLMFTDWRTAAGKAADFLTEKFGIIKDVFERAIGGIRDAMAGGDLALAARIAWLGIKLAWMEGTQELRELWENMKTKVLTSVSNFGFGMADVMVKAWATIKEGWAKSVAFLKTTMASAAASVKGIWSRVTETVSNGLLHMQGLTEEQIANAKKLNAQKTARDIEKANEQEAKDVSNATAERDASIKDIKAQEALMSKAITNAAAAASAARKGENDQAIKDTRTALQKARDEFAAALAKARAGADAGGNEGPTGSEGFDGGAAAKGVAAGPSRGLFNVRALQSLMGGDDGPAKETARNTKEAAEGTNELVRMARGQGILVFPGR